VTATEDLLAELPAPDAAARRSVRLRTEKVIRPAGALAHLDEIAVWLAGWQRTPAPSVRRPAAIVFVADHGVTVEGVSAYPASVTASMLDALRSGVATAAVMARTIGAELSVVDVGVGRPTGNIVTEPALSEDRFASCFQQGRDAVADIECDLLAVGEMGIGNTTAAAAVCHALFGCRAEDWTGRGTGVTDEAYATKVEVVSSAVRRIGETSPLEVLREVGGAELVAMAGAIVEARLRSIPVVLDGFVGTAAVAPLEVVRPGALDHCIAGHCSQEPGHRLLLEKLARVPLLDLGLRLGEASGALLAVPLVKLAAATVVEVATFDDLGIG
jgi:nicotinate-nucleotide--dimethylbenzimidazole phosphoribosyltransferase